MLRDFFLCVWYLYQVPIKMAGLFTAARHRPDNPGMNPEIPEIPDSKGVAKKFYFLCFLFLTVLYV